MRAKSTQLTWPLSQPLRNFTDTGRSDALTTASITLAATPGSFIRALPSPLPVILGAGQPMLMSMRASSPLFSPQMRRAISAIMSGSRPKSCMPQGRSLGAVSMRSVLLPPYFRPLADIISVKVKSQPCSRQMER